MADKLQFSLVSPEREVFSGPVDQVDIPATDGWMGVLANHAPFMTTLLPGVIVVRDGAEERRVFVRGGFAEITPEGLTVLAEEARPASDFSAEEIDQRIARAEQDIKEAGTDEARHLAETTLTRLREIRSAL